MKSSQHVQLKRESGGVIELFYTRGGPQMGFTIDLYEGTLRDGFIPFGITLPNKQYFIKRLSKTLFYFILRHSHHMLWTWKLLE